MTDKIRIDLVRGSAGTECLYINEYRVLGPKPWGGGKIVKTWTVDKKEILEAIK